MTREEGRYEVKFVFDESEMTEAKHWLFRYFGAEEKYAGRFVNSVYFDDIDYESLRDNLAGIAHRRKRRLRWYDYADNTEAGEMVMEQKIRDGRLGYKILFPVPITKQELDKTGASRIADLVRSRMKPEDAIEVFDDYLHPTVYVSYFRKYYENTFGIRVTLDSDIKFHYGPAAGTLGSFNSADYPKRIMEIKFQPNMKNYVSELLRNTHIIPKRHSKYVVGLSIFHQATYI